MICFRSFGVGIGPQGETTLIAEDDNSVTGSLSNVACETVRCDLLIFKI